MHTRATSLHTLLIRRLLILAILISTAVGSFVFIREFNMLNEAIADRSRLGSELLKMRVQDIAQMSKAPWQTVVQTALDDLKNIPPQSSLGRFVWVSVRDPEDRELAQLTDPDFPDRELLIDAANLQIAPKGNEKLGIKPLSRIYTRPSFATLMLIEDDSGRLLGMIRGLYAVKPEVMTTFWSNIARSVGVSILIIILVSALHYPVIRRLLDGLSRLSINLLDANLETVQGLGSAIAKRDSDTDAHNFRVTLYAVRLAESAGLEPSAIRTLIKGAFLHDVGKIGIRDNVLLKEGRLDTDEFEIMKTHVQHGLDIVNKCQWLKDAGEVVGNHHEKFDGTGYLKGLKGEEIPLSARIFSIVDVFDALTSERPYKSAFSLDESVEILQKGKGSQFDPKLLELFGTLAPSLYDTYSHHEAQARSELKRIVQYYFKGDIGELMEENFG
ncbi:MAG: HD domain-containing protein [Methylomicrobium sp.]|nr:HD domain-containing protein [Methylomicrobium sp.]